MGIETTSDAVHGATFWSPNESLDPKGVAMLDVVSDASAVPNINVAVLQTKCMSILHVVYQGR